MYIFLFFKLDNERVRLGTERGETRIVHLYVYDLCFCADNDHNACVVCAQREERS